MDASIEAKIAQLDNWVQECRPGGMVFFGGAGVSTESGIPDFRSTDGLYNQSYDYPPETIISRSFFDSDPAEFYHFYCDRMLFLDAEPNACHLKLAELERRGILSAVATQNIDGLHQKAGSMTVYELHGSVLRNKCMSCGKAFSAPELVNLHECSADGVPRCDCQGIVKPDVVLYEESLDYQTMESTVKAIEGAELMVVAGTSLVVYPAAGMLRYFKGKHLAIVNLSPTYADKSADLCIEAKVGEVFAALA